MEQAINNILFRLSTKFDGNELMIIQDTLISVLKDYDVSLRITAINVVDDELYREMNMYLATIKISGYSERTLSFYKSEITKCLTMIGKKVCDITSNDLLVYFMNYKAIRKVGNVYLNNQRRIINAFFEWLVENEYIDKNPCKKIKKFKEEEKLMKALNDMELEVLRKACKSNYERCVLEVLYSTACRISELVNIKLEDINFDMKEVDIICGKGKKSRTAYLNASSILAIKDYLSERTWESEYLIERSKKPHGKMDIRSVERACRRLQNETGIRVHPHKIRRTTATMLLKKGVPVEEIQVILGHKDISTTLRYALVDKGKVKSDHQKFM